VLFKVTTHFCDTLLWCAEGRRIKSDLESIYSRDGSPNGGPLVSDCVRLDPPSGEMDGRMGMREAESGIGIVVDRIGTKSS
jgi:hypothetical protein